MQRHMGHVVGAVPKYGAFEGERPGADLDLYRHARVQHSTLASKSQHAGHV